MGNNHDKYYAANKRKILILGPQECGKTMLYRTICGQSKEEINSLYIPTEKFSNSQVKLLKNK